MGEYDRIYLGNERIHFRAPFSNVLLVVTLQGEVKTEQVEKAIDKAAGTYPLLKASVQMDEEGKAWYNLEGDNPQLSVIPREGEKHWQDIFLQEERTPFLLSQGPLIRFVFLQGPIDSELIIVWHHILFDGVSATYLLGSILNYLDDPGRDEKPLPVRVIHDEKDLPVPAQKGMAALMAHLLNKSWEKEKAIFGEVQYMQMLATYWSRCETVILTRSIQAASVLELKDRCRLEGVTVNTAVLTAFSAARRTVFADTTTYGNKIGVAINIRSRLKNNPGEGLGNFASAASFVHKYQPGKPFWENARIFQNTINQILASDQKRYSFLQFIMALQPTLLDAVYFYLFAGYKNKTAARLAKILGFREKRQWLGVTNIGQLEVPEYGNKLRVGQVRFIPPHWINSEYICGVATAAGGMCLSLLHRRQSPESDEKIDRALSITLEILENAVAKE
jgi:NRPS condensation-like uncharacterized protein